MDHPGAGSLYAIERIYEFNLFYSAFRRKDDRYLFIRQLLYLGCRHSGSYFAHHYTDWNVILVYFLVQMMEIVKCIIGYVLVKKGVWLNNMTIKAANS